MNLLAEFDFDFGTQYYSMQNVTLNGTQYNAKIVAGTELAEIATMDGTYEIPVKTINIIDENRLIRKNFFDERNREVITGKEVRLYDGSGNLLNTSVIESYRSGEDRVIFRLSDKTQLKQPFTESIAEGPWNMDYVNPEVQQQTIPMVFNTWQRVKAWLVDNRVSVGGEWLLGPRQISSVTRVEVNGTVIKPSLGLYTLIFVGGFWKLKMSHGVIMGEPNNFPQFCWVDVTTPAYTPVQAITSALFGVVDVGTNTDFSNWLISRGINSTNFHVYIRETMSPSDLFQKCSQNLNFMWRKDSNDEVIFEFIDRANILVDQTFVEGLDGGDIPLGVSQNDYDPAAIKNKINTSFGYNPQDNKYKGYIEYNGDITDDGVFDYNLNLEYIVTEAIAIDIAQETYELNKYPVAPISFTTTRDIGKDIFPGGKIQARHRALKTPNSVFGIVLRRRESPANHTIAFDYVDLNFLNPTSFLLDEVGTPICFDGQLLILE